jgi:hypothetical protein
MSSSAASTRSRKRLTWRKLCETERRAYGVLVANFHGPDGMDDTWKENMYLRQARDVSNAFDPVSLTVNMARASFYSIRALARDLDASDADLLFSGTTRDGRQIRLWRPTYDAYWLFFERLLDAHDCPRVDWNTFSNPPWRIDFVRPAADKEILGKLKELREEGREPDTSLF